MTEQPARGAGLVDSLRVAGGAESWGYAALDYFRAYSPQRILAHYQQTRARDQQTVAIQFSCRKADRDVYHRWVSENTDSGWLRRALVEVEPRDSTKPSRVWLQHRERSRPVRVVPLASVLRAARAPSPPEAA